MNSSKVCLWVSKGSVHLLLVNKFLFFYQGDLLILLRIQPLIPSACPQTFFGLAKFANKSWLVQRSWNVSPSFSCSISVGHWGINPFPHLVEIIIIPRKGWQIQALKLNVHLLHILMIQLRILCCQHIFFGHQIFVIFWFLNIHIDGRWSMCIFEFAGWVVEGIFASWISFAWKEGWVEMLSLRIFIIHHCRIIIMCLQRRRIHFDCLRPRKKQLLSSPSLRLSDFSDPLQFESLGRSLPQD